MRQAPLQVQNMQILPAVRSINFGDRISQRQSAARCELPAIGRVG
jgi:hypothetical protein